MGSRINKFMEENDEAACDDKMVKMLRVQLKVMRRTGYFIPR
ncbi:hypothetical protein [Peribacillus muralis]|nr:hypothetical protein [Peribacillus muralis]